MPVSDTQPVSVEDLRLLAGRLGREVLYAGGATQLFIYIYDDGSITDLELTVDTNIGTSPIAVVTVPFTVGEHQVSIPGGATLKADIYRHNDTTMSLSTNMDVSRVVGIRSGGGLAS